MSVTMIENLPVEEQRRRLEFGQLTQGVRYAEVLALGAAEKVADEYSAGAVARLKSAVKALREARKALLAFSNGGTP